MTKKWTQAILLAASCMLMVGCYDPDERCGDNQNYNGATQTCECVEGAVIEEGQCVLCGDNTTVANNECVCEVGFVEDEAGVCQPVPSGLGFDCESDTDCSNPEFPHCQDDPDGTNYCTAQGCSVDEDCSTGFHCAVWEDTPYCERPPTGIGESCSAPEDCAEFEADLCESQVLNVCVSTGCDVSDNNCPIGFFCCDVSAFGGGTMCAPDSFASLCPSS